MGAELSAAADMARRCPAMPNRWSVSLSLTSLGTRRRRLTEVSGVPSMDIANLLGLTHGLQRPELAGIGKFMDLRDRRARFTSCDHLLRIHMRTQQQALRAVPGVRVALRILQMGLVVQCQLNHILIGILIIECGSGTMVY